MFFTNILVTFLFIALVSPLTPISRSCRGNLKQRQQCGNVTYLTLDVQHFCGFMHILLSHTSLTIKYKIVRVCVRQIHKRLVHIFVEDFFLVYTFTFNIFKKTTNKNISKLKKQPSGMEKIKPQCIGLIFVPLNKSMFCTKLRK